MADVEAAVVDDLLAAYRNARLQANGSNVSSNVMNDIRRSAIAARDALRAGGSPQAERIDEFIQATAREDSLQRVKNVASTGLGVTNAVGKAVGIGGLANLSWAVVVGLGVLGVFLGWFLMVNLAVALGMALAAAVPIGLVLSRGSMMAGEAWKSYERYMSTSDPGRNIINAIIVPAEERFFTAVPGRPVRLRTTTVVAVGQKSVVTVAGASFAVGLVVGLLIGADQA